MNNLYTNIITTEKTLVQTRLHRGLFHFGLNNNLFLISSR